MGGSFLEEAVSQIMPMLNVDIVCKQILILLRLTWELEQDLAAHKAAKKAGQRLIRSLEKDNELLRAEIRILKCKQHRLKSAAIGRR